MNKLLLTIGLMFLIGIAIYAFSSSSETSQTTTQVGPQNPTYADVEIKLNIEGRDISGKLVFEFPNMQRCQAEAANKQSFIQEYNTQCSEQNICKSIHIGNCSSYVDDKYLSMMNKQFKGSHYMHISNTTNTNERGVIAFWGLSDQESMNLCLENQKERREKNIVTECL